MDFTSKYEGSYHVDESEFVLTFVSSSCSKKMRYKEPLLKVTSQNHSTGLDTSVKHGGRSSDHENYLG